MPRTTVEFAQGVVGLPWVIDGISEADEQWAISSTGRRLPCTTRLFARTIVGLPWVIDDITEDEVEALVVSGLACRDRRCSCSDDGWAFLGGRRRFPDGEPAALSSLDVLADHDVAFAKTIAGLPWMADGVTQPESWALRSFDGLAAGNNLEFAQTIADLEWVADDITIAEAGAIYSMRTLYEDGLMDELAKEPWFADGLDDEDVSLLTTLSTIRDRSTKLYDDLVRSRHVRSASITLPMAGKVRLWAFQATPFPAGEDTLRMLEEAVRSAEAFMEAPFPWADVILVVPPETAQGFDAAGVNFGPFITVNRYGTDELERGVVYHEVGHYYLYGDIGPQWLSEGGADFMDAYTRDRIGLEDLRDRKPTVLEVVESECFAVGISDIRELNERLPVDPDAFGCNYRMGELFLLSMVETLGERATSAALRELYLTSRSELRPVTEAEIYRAFLKHTPPGLEGEFLALYEELHGGSYDDDEDS